MAVTPIEAGFNYAGLLTAGRMFSILLPIYCAVITAGIVWMIYKGLLETSWKSLLTYCFSVGLLLAFFGVHKTINSNVVISQAESDGAPLVSSDYSGKAFAGRFAASSGATSSGLSWINSFLDTMVIKCVQAVDSTAKEDVDKFISGSPFSFIEMQKTTWGSRVKNPATRASLLKFLQGPYQDAIYTWQKAGYPGGKGRKILYPGDFAESYSKEESQKWKEIERDIRNEKINEIDDTVVRWHQKIRALWDKDYLIRKTIENETAAAIKNSSLDAFRPESKLGRYVTKQVGGLGRRIALALTELLTSVILPAIPVVQGIANYITLAAFPLIFFLAIFPNNLMILGWYFIGLLWVKSWSIGWAILNSVQNLGWYFSASTVGSVAGGENYLAGLILPVLTLGLLPIIPAVLLQLLTKGMGSAVAGAHAVFEGGAGHAVGAVSGGASKVGGAVVAPPRDKNE